MLRLIAVVAWLIATLSPAVAEPVNAAFPSPSIKLMFALEAVESLSPQATIDLPADGAGQRLRMRLEARGPGPIYRWAVFTLRNPEAAPQELVLAIPHQGFVGSGLVWPRRAGSRTLGIEASAGRQPEPVANLAAESFALTVPPGMAVTYALEVSAAGLDDVSLWRRSAFDAAAQQYGFFRGVVLGIAVLLGIAIICLIIVKPRAVFPAGALFVWSAVAFLTIEAGYLPSIIELVPALAGSEQKLRAIVEALMLAGLIAALVTFVELRRRIPTAGAFLMVLGGGAVALAAYAWFEPYMAAGLARMAFAAVVVVGLALIIVLWWRGVIRARASLFGWVMLTLWTAAAGAGVLSLIDAELMRPLVSAGLVLVLVTMGFTLAQFAFNQGIASSRFFEEAGRRALALAGSEQAVWDWQAEDRVLYVGPEAERALGLEAGTITGNDLKGWLDLIHPADRSAYAGAVEAAERRGRGGFSQEFRLRRGDGSYRWFVLRARAMPGEDGRASRLIGTLTDVTALKRSEDRLLSDAVRDRITGLPNRALFIDRLDRAMRGARSQGQAGLHVIAMDIDRFRSVNDALGHAAGDALLNTVGRRIAALIGPEDTLARLPGDQFGIIYDGGNSHSDIGSLVESVAEAVARPIRLRGGEVAVTASMGVAPFDAEGRGPEDLLKDAEIALYEAKRAGNGAVEFFRADMRVDGSELVRLEQDLRRAIERNEIEVVYQPIMRLADRELAGFEALMRWRRAGEVLKPESFLGLAEETGIIRELGRHVLDEAGRQLGIWQRAFRPQQPLFVAVNVSSAQLLNHQLVEDVRALIGREDIRAGTLKLELTESLVMENPELAQKVLQRLKQMGVALACDDFGTGYSSLAHLSRLPFDTVKIDRAFLEAGPEDDERGSIILNAIIRLAHDLELSLVAEGIETEEQKARLAELGCDYGQGFLFGPPVTTRQVIEALGGLASAGGRRSGLSAFIDRLVGHGDGEVEPARGADPSLAMAGMPAAVGNAASAAEPAGEPEPEPAWPSQSEGEPGPVAAASAQAPEEDADMVLDLTGLMPSASAHPAKSVPEIGAAPLAPRLAWQAGSGEDEPVPAPGPVAEAPAIAAPLTKPYEDERKLPGEPESAVDTPAAAVKPDLRRVEKPAPRSTKKRRLRPKQKALQ